MVPEGYLWISRSLSLHVLLIDAAVLGRKPGDADLVKVTEVAVFSAFRRIDCR